MEMICKDNTIKTITENAAKLMQSIDYHNRLIAAAFGTQEIDITANDPAGDGQLRQALYETIETLEETKKAFKSKRLEILRKKLTKVLMETG